MKRFSKGEKCPKCGNRAINIVWEPTFEYLDLSCLRCKYMWTMQPLDQSKGKKKEA